jgi:hypothetical protein
MVSQKEVFDRMKRYRQERNELREQMEELKDLPQKILELEQRFSALEKKVAYLDQFVNQGQSEKYLVEEDDTTEVMQHHLVDEDISPVSQQEVESNQTSEEYIIDQYYHNPNFLSQHAYKVTPTKKCLEDIYLNRANEVIFQLTNQSDYWIVELESGGYCLLPDLDLKINTNIKTVKTVFDLQDYQENSAKTFQVIKTAKVHEITDKEWKLSEKGILQF